MKTSLRMGHSHNKTLYITVKCLTKEVRHVLVDNGSAFNLCPLSTLRRLGKEKTMRASRATIRAFDDMRKEVIGDVELEGTIGPTVFAIDIQIVEISSAFNFLLGRLWIHMAGAIPSSLHQNVKFVVNGKLITIHGEVGFNAYVENEIPYLEPKEVEEASYHSLELVHIVHTPISSKIRVPELSTSTNMTDKVLSEYGYVPGMGLGKNTQGIVKPIVASALAKRGGIGYRGESKGYKNHYDPCGDRSRG